MLLSIRSLLSPKQPSAPQSSEEARLLSLAQEGDRGAFAALLRRHQDRIVGKATRLLGSREDAMDILQETSLIFFRRLQHIDPNGNLGGWLSQVSVRLCYKVLKGRVEGQVVEEETSAPAPQERRVEAREFGDVLERCLKRLSPQERTAFVLRDLEGMDGHQVSALMECKATTARGYYFTARKKLAQILSQEHPEWLDVIGGKEEQS